MDFRFSSPLHSISLLSGHAVHRIKSSSRASRLFQFTQNTERDFNGENHENQRSSSLPVADLPMNYEFIKIIYETKTLTAERRM
jgi:hypothetical protein